MSKKCKKVSNETMCKYLTAYWKSDSNAAKAAKKLGVTYSQYHYVVSKAIAELKKANQPYQTKDTHLDTLVSNARSFFGVNNKRANHLMYSMPVFDSIEIAKQRLRKVVPVDEQFIIDVFYNTVIFHERNTKTNA